MLSGLGVLNELEGCTCALDGAHMDAGALVSLDPLLDHIHLVLNVTKSATAVRDPLFVTFTLIACGTTGHVCATPELYRGWPLGEGI